MPQNTSKLDVGKMIKSIVSNRALLGIIAAAIMLLLGMPVSYTHLTLPTILLV